MIVGCIWLKDFAASNGFRGDIQWIEIVRESYIADQIRFSHVEGFTGNKICENEDKKITIEKLLDVLGIIDIVMILFSCVTDIQ